MRRIAGHDDRVAFIILEALRAVEHRERRIHAAVEKRCRTVGDLRILLNHDLDVFLIRLRGRRLHDLVVKVHRCRGPEAADEPHFEGFRKALGRSLDRFHGGISQEVDDGKSPQTQLFGKARHLRAVGDKHLSAGFKELLARLHHHLFVF